MRKSLRALCANNKLLGEVWPRLSLPEIRGLGINSSSDLKHEVLLRHNRVLHSEACNETDSFSAPRCWELKVIDLECPITIRGKTWIIALRSKCHSNVLCLLETRLPNL